MLRLSLILIAAVCATSIALQAIRGHGPVEMALYLTIGSVILVPNALFLIGVSAALHSALRDKYLAYAV